MLRRREFIRHAGTAACLGMMGHGNNRAAGDEVSKRRKHFPNIVAIDADDLGYSDPECCDLQSKVPIPNLNTRYPFFSERDEI